MFVLYLFIRVFAVWVLNFKSIPNNLLEELLLIFTERILTLLGFWLSSRYDYTIFLLDDWKIFWYVAQFYSEYFAIYGSVLFCVLTLKLRQRSLITRLINFFIIFRFLCRFYVSFCRFWKNILSTISLIFIGARLSGEDIFDCLHAECQTGKKSR